MKPFLRDLPLMIQTLGTGQQKIARSIEWTNSLTDSICTFLRQEKTALFCGENHMKATKKIQERCRMRDLSEEQLYKCNC